MIKFTADGDRMAIYIKIKQNSASVGSLGWANTGKQLLIEGESQAHRAKIQAVVEDVAARRKLKKSRSLVRAGAQAWVDAAPGNSMTVLLDAHTPSLSRVNLADLPFAILKHAYWRPQALGLRKDNVDGKAEKRRRCRLPYYLFEKWPKEETWVDKVLDQLLAGAPPRAVGDAFAAVDPRLQGSSFGLVSEHAAALRPYVGDPDFVIFDERRRALVLGEIKISAKKTNGRYSFEQFSKYMLYGALVQLSGLARTVTHVIVAPSDDPKEFCSDAKLWSPQVEESSGSLAVAPDGIRLTGELKRGYRDFDSWKRYASACLTDEEWREANPGYGKTEVERLLTAKTSPVLVPTYVVTWDRICRELARSCQSHHAEHLVSAIDRLRKLGTGQT